MNGYDLANFFPLYTAASYGQVKMLLLLLKFGANLEQRSRPEGFTALHAAACHGHLPIVQSLLDSGANINVLGGAGSTPVLMAAGGSHVDIVRTFIDRGADLNIQNRNGNTVLIHAAATGNLEVLQLALEAEADTALRIRPGWNALDMACFLGQLEAVRMLLAQNADVHESLQVASAKGHTQVCKLLLDYGIDIETEDSQGITPLIASCWYGDFEVVKLLLKRGANPSGGSDVALPILAASEVGCLDCVRLLVEAGADVNWRSSEGVYALAVARREGHAEVVEFLKAHGAIDYDQEQQRRDSEVFEAVSDDDPIGLKALLHEGASIKRTDEQGRTPLMVAAERGHGEIVRVLLDAGAEIDAVHKATGETALALAAKHGHLDVLRILVESGANLNTQTRNTGLTPIASAASHGHISVVRLLLGVGAVADLRALFCAIASGNPEIVELVVEADVDLNGEDPNSGLTPLLQAIHDGNTTVIEILLVAGAHVNRRSIKGVTPLAAAAQSGRSDILGLLISAGTEVEFDREALIRASAAGQLEIVRQLILAGARADTKALVRAAEEGHVEVVRALLEAGADPYSETKHGDTAVGQALARGHFGVAEILQQWPGGNGGNGEIMHHSGRKWTEGGPPAAFDRGGGRGQFRRGSRRLLQTHRVEQGIHTERSHHSTRRKSHGKGTTIRSKPEASGKCGTTH